MVLASRMTHQSTALHPGKTEIYIKLLHRGCVFYGAGDNSLVILHHPAKFFEILVLILNE